MEPTVPLAIGIIALAFLALGAIADDRRARVRRRVEVAADPPLIHSINDDRCIGCEACVDVCPTEVLELVDHKARVIRFSDCVQCEQCANACPTTALVMHRRGFTPQTLTVPELDDHFQTGVPGQYLIGEVAGKPLVKNAANLGRAVVEHITRAYSKRPPEGVLDVAIVGSGPGGLSAGLTCLRNKLTCVVLEKEHVLASTVSRYPKGKLFMAEPVDSGNVSYLPVFDASKEELVGAWQKVVDGAKLPVKLGEAVESVKRDDDGLFTIKSTVAKYRARSVVLATGLRGKPRLLAVPGANLEKVKSRLDDPDELAGKHVLVVGGGDSAVEGAMSLADAGATVTLSYRGDGFKRCKGANQKRLAEMSSAGKLVVLLESNVKEFTADMVSIALKGGELSTVPNHAAFVLIGADTPVSWLEANGVRFVEREHLYALGSTEATLRTLVPDATECPRTPEEALARLLGKEPARPSHKRLRSVVSHIGDEFLDVVTNVTGIFKLSTFEEPEPRRSTVGRRTGASKVVPAERLVRRPPPPPPSPKLFAAPRAPDLLLDPPQAYNPQENPFEPEKTAELHAYRRSSAAARAAKVKRQRSVVGEITEDMASLPARMLARSRDFSAEVSRITPLPGFRALRETTTDAHAALDGKTRVTPPPVHEPKSFDAAFDDSDVHEVFEAQRTRVEPVPPLRTSSPPPPLASAPLAPNPFADMSDTDVANAIDVHSPQTSHSTVAKDTEETPSIKRAAPPPLPRAIPKPVRAQTVGRGSAALEPGAHVALRRMPTHVPVPPPHDVRRAPAVPPARAPRGTDVPVPPPIPRRPPPIPHVPKKGSG